MVAVCFKLVLCDREGYNRSYSKMCYYIQRCQQLSAKKTENIEIDKKGGGGRLFCDETFLFVVVVCQPLQGTCQTYGDGRTQKETRSSHKIKV